MSDTIIGTDQTVCYDASGEPIDCAGTGQDGELRAGRPWTAPRFSTDGDIVRDAMTGLVWQRDAAMADSPMTWPEAFDWIDSLNAAAIANRRSWRLPERSELFSLISHANFNPALPDGHPFVNVFSGYYWTATPCSRLPKQAWYIHLGGARVFKGMRHGSYLIWPVCGGPEATIGNASMVEPVTDETIRDRYTGLMWTRNADLVGAPVDWQGALHAVRQLNAIFACGYSDWRLPNVRELESLVAVGHHSPAIRGSRHFGDIRDGYWSSTTSVYEPSYAWVLYTEDGNIGVGYKQHPTFRVWAVRSSPRARAVASTLPLPPSTTPEAS
jgi:hypothetical protein